ncbi:MAG: hypothetical protein ABI681_04305 [Gemmatimonadales bacterium]
MKARIIVAAVAAAVTAGSSPLAAQGIDPQCPPGSQNGAGQPDNTMVAQDACQKAIDLFKYMAPQLGAVLAGGNPTQGVSGNLGGVGHFSIGLRGNGLRGSLPEVDKVVPNTRGALQSTYAIDTKPIGFVTADLALGVYQGMGTNGLGALDLLVTGSYVPEYSGSSVEVSVPSGSFKLGLGAKVGLLKETAVRPGISLSYVSRGLPDVNITGISGDDSLFLKDVKVNARSWRVVAGKSFMFLGAAAGFGRDSYDSDAAITVKVAPRPATQGGTGGPIALGQKLSRNNLFGSVWITSQVLRVVGEIGRVSGGDIVTYNQFSGVQAADARTYASIGVSFGR